MKKILMAFLLILSSLTATAQAAEIKCYRYAESKSPTFVLKGKTLKAGISVLDVNNTVPTVVDNAASFEKISFQTLSRAKKTSNGYSFEIKNPDSNSDYTDMISILINSVSNSSNPQTPRISMITLLNYHSANSEAESRVYLCTRLEVKL